MQKGRQIKQSRFRAPIIPYLKFTFRQFRPTCFFLKGRLIGRCVRSWIECIIQPCSFHWPNLWDVPIAFRSCWVQMDFHSLISDVAPIEWVSTEPMTADVIYVKFMSSIYKTDGSVRLYIKDRTISVAFSRYAIPLDFPSGLWRKAARREEEIGREAEGCATPHFVAFPVGLQPVLPRSLFSWPCLSWNVLMYLASLGRQRRNA